MILDSDINPILVAYVKYCAKEDKYVKILDQGNSLVLMYIMLWALGLLGPITSLVQHTYTCTALYLYRTLMPHIYGTDVYFLIMKIQYKSFSISNINFQKIYLI